MYIMLVLSCIVISQERTVPISVVSGAYWKRIPDAVLYESSVPLYYKTVWPSLDIVQLPKDNVNLGFCSLQSDVKCILFKWIKYVDKVVGQKIKVINSSFGDNLFEDQGHPRGKRALNFMGDFMHYCCGVATTKELKPLFTNEQSLRNFDVQLQTQLKEAYAEIGDLTLNISDYSRQVEATFAQVINVGMNLSKVIDRLQEQESVRANEVDQKLYGLLQVAAHSVARQVQTQQLIARLELTSQCREKKIPTIVVQPHILLNDLTKLTNLIKPDGYELVIPFSDITSYFKLDIADCVISDNTILVTVKIPIRKFNSNWKLYEVIGTPFAWNNNTCVLQHETTYLAINHDVMMPIKGSALHDCQPHHNVLCYVPRYMSDVVSNSACVRKLFTGASIQELSSVCIFSCTPGSTPSVNRVDDETYVVTHGTGSLQMQCRYHQSRNLSMPHEGMPGALEVKVPCDCQLSLGNQVLVSVNYPCNTNATSIFSLIHVIPAAWSKLKSLNVNSMQTHVSSSFETFQECLDHEWPIKIPHLNVSFSGKPSLIPEKLLPVQLDQDTYLSFSAILHGLFMMLLVIIIVKNPYLLGIQCIRPVHAKPMTEDVINEHVCTFILTGSISLLLYVIWRVLRRYLCSRRQKEQVTAVSKSTEELPNDLVIAKVDGKELQVSLKWSK